jgi:NEDD8-activating enzyme E1 regulatory subunit
VDLEQILATSPPFTVILYTLPLQTAHVELIKAYGRAQKISIVSIHSVGFYSYFHIDLPGTFAIVDTHPDETATTDLRLLSPWEELSEFAKELTQDIDNMDNHEHGHLPYVVILLHYLDVWKSSHDGSYPSSYAEKVAFRTTVSDAIRRNNAEGGEENFDEAVAAVVKTITKPSLPSSLKEVFEYQPTDAVSVPTGHLFPSSIVMPQCQHSLNVAREPIKLLDYRGCRKEILRDISTFASTGRPPRYESSVECVH